MNLQQMKFMFITAILESLWTGVVSPPLLNVSTLASKELTSYLEESEYARESIQTELWRNSMITNLKILTFVLGVGAIPLNSIGSNWYDDLLKEFKPNRKFIEYLVSSIREGSPIAPIILCRDKNPERYLIVDGHHRVYAAARELNLQKSQVSF